MADIDDERLSELVHFTGHYVLGSMPDTHAALLELRRHRSTARRISEMALSLEHALDPNMRQVGSDLRARLNGR